MFRFCLVLILIVEAISLALLPLVAPGMVVALVVSPVILLTVVLAFVLYPKLGGVSYSTWRLTPERIAAHKPPDTLSKTEPIALSRFIVERAAEIRRAMLDTPSEVQIEICALGYRACVNDMITLTHLANEELTEAGIVRRMKLKRARRKATEALSGARTALPPGTLRTTHQEKQ
ncbi:MAG: hypothetical protein WA990_02830 [Rubrobacteraceae bacterium]